MEDIGDGEKRGIVYLSSVPSGMQFTHVKQQLQRYGEVTRFWMANRIDHGCSPAGSPNGTDPAIGCARHASRGLLPVHTP